MARGSIFQQIPELGSPRGLAFNVPEKQMIFLFWSGLLIWGRAIDLAIGTAGGVIAAGILDMEVDGEQCLSFGTRRCL